MYCDTACIFPEMAKGVQFARGICFAEEEPHNTSMRSVRVSEDHIYTDVKQLWTSLDYANNMKLCHAPISLVCKISALLMKFCTCLYNCEQVKGYFEVDAPSLGKYLQGAE